MHSRTNHRHEKSIKTFRYLLPISAAGLLLGAYVGASADEGPIPAWIKDAAKFWVEGNVDGWTFLNTLQFLVDGGVLVLPDAEPASGTPAAEAEYERLTTMIHPDAKQGTITRIVDGDTLLFDAICYRLILIDMPERDETGFWEATNALKELCPRDSVAYMDDDSIRPFDKYG